MVQLLTPCTDHERHNAVLQTDRQTDGRTTLWCQEPDRFDKNSI